MILFLYLILTTIIACSPKSSERYETKVDTGRIDIITSLNTGYDFNNNNTDSDYATFFVVISDTGLSYFTLHKKMFDLNKQLNIPIDTMGRFFNKMKDIIALPDNDADEIYAGSYYPRRFPSEHLSLEYLAFYASHARQKTIALVTGIYETEEKADSALSVLKKTEINAFKIKSDIYVGCMH